jgi:hypothetical protein
MNFGNSIGFLAVGCLTLSACGLGTDANIGDDTRNQQTASGGETSSGGATSSTGGADSTSGGTTSAGGTKGNGGAVSSSGGTAGGAKCGTKVCGAGEYCCNESCGICAAEGSACIEIFCTPDAGPPACPVQTYACQNNYVWSKTECKCVPPSCLGGIVPCPSNSVWSGVTCQCEPKVSVCATDSDCRTESNYCDSCNCLALGTGEKAPVCTGVIVDCIADPCTVNKKKAVCMSGSCVLQ